jgi:protein-disulfide isomerase
MKSPSPRLLLVATALLLTLPAAAQQAVPAGQGDTFKDTSLVKPPAGSKVAIYEFEDLECPACSRAFPIVHAAVEHYKIPLIRHDFPLRGHVWSLDAAITARYIQDKISPQAAEEYRRAVFANQTSILTKEDLQAFTQKYFQSHGRVMPFVMDPTGQFAKEVNDDYELGLRIGLLHTPTIFVASQKGWIQVVDINQLYQTLDNVIAQVGGTGSSTTANSKLRHPATPQR